MKYKLNALFKIRTIQEYGSILFFLGIFFLPSTLFIGLIFLIPSALLSSFLNYKVFLKDKWNYPFLIFGAFILLSAFLQNFFLINNYADIWDPSLSLIGLANWLPFIWLFWAFQPYLNSKAKRKFFSVILVSGTFPVLITGFGQYFFDWTGPFYTLNKLIIWYQRPIDSPGGLSGLFNNQNYAGSWLNFVWPFCIALFLEKRKNFFYKTFSLGFLLSVCFAAFLTYSRNAWAGLLTSFPIVVGRKGVKILLLFILACIFVVFFILLPISSGDIQNDLRSFLPKKILLEFTSEGYKGLDSTRTEIISSAINLIKKSPIFGIGAASFSAIYLLETSYWKGHSHNLIIELAVSYGLPATLTLFLTITFIIIISARYIFFNSNLDNVSIFDKAYWAALFFFLTSQLADIQYFDGKISIVAWILISALKNIIEENKTE